MIKNLFLILCALVFAHQSWAVKIAVIDSGTDVKHIGLAGKIWNNPNENADNERDDDGNDYPNDIHGWNFAENNYFLIDYKYAELYKNLDLFKFMEVQARMLNRQLTDEDKEWLKQKREDSKFIQALQTFGNFIHGTHVAGICAKWATHPEIVGIKLLPTEVNPIIGRAHRQAEKVNTNPKDPVLTGKRIQIIKQLLAALGSQSGASFIPIGRYIKGVDAQVANGSFGVGITQASMFAKLLFKIFFFREAQKEEYLPLAKVFLEETTKSQKVLTTLSPNTLFVFAAGNDGSDNDIYPSAPASIKADNVISVAASFGNHALAVFSNYGATSVDLAAPGVIIESTIPMDRTLAISGTSQAAPQVAAVAALVREINPKLSPLEVKKILMGTVDKKDFLVGKVVSSGVLNKDRAEKAAKLSTKMILDAAIEQSGEFIRDMPSDGMEGAPIAFQEMLAAPILPMTATFVLGQE